MDKINDNKKKRGYHFYTLEEIQFLKNTNEEGITLQQVTDRFNARFHTNISKVAIAKIKLKHGIKSKFNMSRFTSDRLKGNKFGLGLKPTNGFKKGHMPPRTRALGSERINKDGFIEVKISPRKWRLKHHIIYEQTHNCKIKRGDKIIFLDRNLRNFDINNLAKITNTQQAILAKTSIKSTIPEITLAEIELAKYIETIAHIRDRKLSKKRSV